MSVLRCSGDEEEQGLWTCGSLECLCHHPAGHVGGRSIKGLPTQGRVAHPRARHVQGDLRRVEGSPRVAGSSWGAWPVHVVCLFPFLTRGRGELDQTVTCRGPHQHSSLGCSVHSECAGRSALNPGRGRRFGTRGNPCTQTACAHVVCLLAGDLDGLLDHLWQHWGLTLGGIGLAVSLILAACDGDVQAGRRGGAGRHKRYE